MGFVELRQARGVYSRVRTRMPILNGSLFSEVSVEHLIGYVGLWVWDPGTGVS